MKAQFEQILEQIRKHPRLVSVEDCELYLDSQSVQRQCFENGRLKKKGVESEVWAQLRVLLRRQPGESTSILGSSDDVDALVDAAIASAERSSADPWFRFPLAKPKHLDEVPETRARFPSALGSGCDIPINETYEIWDRECLFWRRLEKIQSHYLKSGCRLQLSHPLYVNTRLKEFDANWEGKENFFSQWKDETTQIISLATEAVVECDHIIFRPRVTSQILSKIGNWFCADRVQSKNSPLSKRNNKKVFSSQLSLIEGEKRDASFDLSPFDLEGTQCTSTALIRNGVVENFLYDSYVAAKDNRPSTGNYVRCLETGESQIAPTSLYFEVGPQSLSHAEQKLARCVALEELSEFTQLPGIGSEVELVGSGWVLEHGKPKSYHMKLRIKCDMLEQLGKVAAVGNDLSFYGLCGSPSILFKEMPLSLQR